MFRRLKHILAEGEVFQNLEHPLQSDSSSSEYWSKQNGPLFVLGEYRGNCS